MSRPPRASEHRSPSQRATATPQPPLTVREHMVLQVAGDAYADAAAREQRARELLGMDLAELSRTATGLLDRPAAAAAYPLAVRRLRRLRDRRRAERARATRIEHLF